MSLACGWTARTFPEKSLFPLCVPLTTPRKADHQGLVDLAAFMGLKCSLAQAKEIWKSHKYSSPPGGYNTYGLPLETLEWMNVTMSFLLPEPMLNRWGLLRTNSHASV